MNRKLEAAYQETLIKQKLSKLAQALFWYDNVPDDKTIVEYVYKMREYYRKLATLGVEVEDD